MRRGSATRCGPRNCWCRRIWEAEFGVRGGHWHHGEIGLDQALFTRPVPGANHYAVPVPGLYLCGASSHPGGGVLGLAGRNAARRIVDEKGAR